MGERSLGTEDRIGVQVEQGYDDGCAPASLNWDKQFRRSSEGAVLVGMGAAEVGVGV